MTVKLSSPEVCVQVNYYPKWHEGRGDTKVVMQKWGKHPHHGRVRDLQFQVKIKGVSVWQYFISFHCSAQISTDRAEHVILQGPTIHFSRFVLF